MSAHVRRLPALDRRLGAAAIALLALTLGACSAADGTAQPTGEASAAAEDASTDAPSGEATADGEQAETAAGAVSVTREVEHDGGLLQVDVAPVVRKGEFARLTVTLTSLRNPDGDDAWFFYSFFSLTQTDAAGFQLVDLEGQKRYLVAMDSAGDCLCTTDINSMSLVEGGTAQIDATFAAPPSEVKTIDVVLPGVAGTIADVAVS